MLVRLTHAHSSWHHGADVPRHSVLVSGDVGELHHPLDPRPVHALRLQVDQDQVVVRAPRDESVPLVHQRLHSACQVGRLFADLRIFYYNELHTDQDSSQ